MRTLRTKLRRDLVARRWQFGAVVATIFLGVTLYAASFDAFRNLQASYNETYDKLAFADLTVTGGQISTFASKAKDTDGVADVTTRTQADIPFRIDAEQKLLGRIVGMPTDRQPSVDKIDMLSGSYLDSKQSSGVVVEQHMADHFGLEAGDQLDLSTPDGWQTVDVLGTAASAEYIWPARSRQDSLTTPEDFGVLFVPEELAQSAGGTAAVQQALVLYDHDVDRGALDHSLSAAANDDDATNVETQAEQPSNALLQEDVSGFGELSVLFPALFLTAAGLASFVLLNRIVFSQRTQIGTLLANGLGGRAVRRHFLAYGITVGLVGAIVGTGVGMLLGRLITGFYTAAISVPDTVTRFWPLTPVVGIAFGLVAGSLAAWVPARAASRIEPAEAMRGTVPTADGKRSLVERLFPPLSHLPARWKMMLRGLGRAKRRSLSTVLGVVLSLTLILVSWGMVDTTQILLDRQFEEIQREDAQLYFGVSLDGARVESVENVEGVARVESASQLAVSLRHDDELYATDLFAFEQDTQMHEFLTGSGKSKTLPEEGILAGNALKDVLGVEAGDDVELALTALDSTVKTKIAGFVDEPLGTLAYISLGQLADLLGSASPPQDPSVLEAPSIASVMVQYEDGADRETMSQRLSALPDVAAFIDSRALFDTAQSLLGLFYAFVGVMLVFGAVMAFALIFNTTSANLAERSVEIATLRANGLSRGKIARLLTSENLLLTATGIAPGLIAGYALSAVFMTQFSTDLFQFDLEMRGRTLVLSALAIVAVTLLSLWPGLRAVGRLDIAKVARERSQ